MNLLKTSVLNGLAVLIKTAIMFILNKILAVYVGPSGYAMIGQFQNFIQMITTFAGSAINTAVIKYTAEYYESESKQVAIWKTAGSLVLVFSISFSFLILIFQKQLSVYIFQTIEYQSVFRWFSLFLVLFNLNALLLAILNGKKEIQKLVFANIAGSIVSLLITSLLTIQYNLYGALISLSIYQSLAFFVTVFLCYKTKWFKFSNLFGRIEPEITKKLAAFALMALVSTICIPLSQMVIRFYLTHEFGLNYAGYWDAMMRVSSSYLMLVTTILGVYYLPRLSEINSVTEIKKEIFLGYKFILPFSIIFGFLIYIFREEIILILFTSSFLPIKELFLWQTIGDVLKIGSWILGYLMLSKAMVRLYILTEIIYILFSIFSSYIFTQIYGFNGMSFAHFLSYAVHWIILGIFVFRGIK